MMQLLELLIKVLVSGLLIATGLVKEGSPRTGRVQLRVMTKTVLVKNSRGKKRGGARSLETQGRRA